MTEVAAGMTCPHCSASNPIGGQFCESCGMALPSATPTGPRVVDHKAFATTVVGQQLQSADLHKQQKRASGALLAVAIIQTLVIGFLVFVANQNNRANVLLHNPMILTIGALAVVFWCLFFWARVQPLPAAIVGMVLYATLVVVNVIVSLSNLPPSGGPPSARSGGLGVSFLDLVILVVLGQAISAGIKYRKMLQGGIA